MDLEIKGVDAVVMDMVVGNYSIQTTENPCCSRRGACFEKYGIGFRKGDVELRDAVQDALLAMANDGTIAEISNKWFGRDISVVGK